MNSTRLITLTLQHRDVPLAEQLKLLRDSFRRLRGSKVWKASVTACVYVVEIGYNARTETWHPHVHVVADGEYLPHAKLKAAWKKASRGSYVVDVRLARSRSRAAEYVAKYIAKPAVIGSWPPERIREFASATAGQRLLGTTGYLHGATLDPRDPNEDRGTSRPVLTLREFEWLLDAGWEPAVRALDVLAYALPELHRLYPQARPRPPDGDEGCVLDVMQDLAEEMEAVYLELRAHDRQREELAERGLDNGWYLTQPLP